MCVDVDGCVLMDMCVDIWVCECMDVCVCVWMCVDGYVGGL